MQYAHIKDCHLLSVSAELHGPSPQGLCIDTFSVAIQ